MVEWPRSSHHGEDDEAGIGERGGHDDRRRRSGRNDIHAGHYALRPCQGRGGVRSLRQYVYTQRVFSFCVYCARSSCLLRGIRTVKLRFTLSIDPAGIRLGYEGTACGSCCSRHSPEWFWHRRPLPPSRFSFASGHFPNRWTRPGHRTDHPIARLLGGLGHATRRSGPEPKPGPESPSPRCVRAVSRRPLGVTAPDKGLAYTNRSRQRSSRPNHRIRRLCRTRSSPKTGDV